MTILDYINNAPDMVPSNYQRRAGEDLYLGTTTKGNIFLVVDHQTHWSTQLLDPSTGRVVSYRRRSHNNIDAVHRFLEMN